MPQFFYDTDIPSESMVYVEIVYKYIVEKFKIDNLTVIFECTDVWRSDYSKLNDFVYCENDKFIPILVRSYDGNVKMKIPQFNYWDLDITKVFSLNVNQILHDAFEKNEFAFDFEKFELSTIDNFMKEWNFVISSASKYDKILFRRDVIEIVHLSKQDNTKNKTEEIEIPIIIYDKLAEKSSCIEIRMFRPNLLKHLTEEDMIIIQDLEIKYNIEFKFGRFNNAANNFMNAWNPETILKETTIKFLLHNITESNDYEKLFEYILKHDDINKYESLFWIRDFWRHIKLNCFGCLLKKDSNISTNLRALLRLMYISSPTILKTYETKILNPKLIDTINGINPYFWFALKLGSNPRRALCYDIALEFEDSELLFEIK